MAGPQRRVTSVRAIIEFRSFRRRHVTGIRAIVEFRPVILDVTISVSPLVVTTSLVGNGTVDDMAIVSPLIVTATIAGQWNTGNVTTVVALPLAITTVLFATVGGEDINVSPLVVKTRITSRFYVLPTSGLPSYRVELRNSAGELTYLFALNVTVEWSSLRLGGCETATVNIIDPPSNLNPNTIQGYDLQIKLNRGDGYQTWWRGFIDHTVLRLGEPNELTLFATGWVQRLERIAVVSLGFSLEGGTVRFEKLDAAEIARRLIDRAIGFGVLLSYDSITVPNSGFVIESISFNESTFSALQDLAGLAGSSEWGVSPKNSFYFLPPSSEIAHVFFVGKDVLVKEHSIISRSLVNRIYLVGGQGYLAIIENLSNLVTDVSQLLDNSFVSFGQATSNQKLLQPFVSSKNTLSRVSVKIGKTGWDTNSVVDGDMELIDGSSPPNWKKLWDRTIRRKSTIFPYLGNQCLEIRHNESGKGKYGVYQNVSVSVSEEYFFSVWVRNPTSEGPITVELRDGSAALGSTADILSTITALNQPGWQRLSETVVPSTNILGIRLYAINKKGGTGKDPFYIDNVLLFHGADVELSIIERLSAGPPPTYDEDNPLAVAVVPFESIPATPALVNVYLTASPLLSSKTYGVRLRSLGELSNSRYFQLRIQTPAPGLELWVNHGTTWQSVGGQAYFSISLPANQQQGVYSEVVNNSNITNDADAALWGSSLLAAMSIPVERAMVDVSFGRSPMIEETVPLGLVKVVGTPNLSLRLERISYKISEAGLEASLELGSVLPKLASVLRYIENKLSQIKM